MSNPKVWELWLANVAQDLANDPNRTVFNASPIDSWASGHCVCANCTAWDHPDGEPRVFNWLKKNEQRPATSDRDVTFANRLGGLLKQKYPATVGPLYYIMAQLVWDPAADADAILADYYQRAFGPAGLAVREYFVAIEKARMAFTSKSGEAGVFTFPQLYTAGLLRDSQGRIDRASAAVPAGSHYAERVAFIQAGLTYTRMQVENIALMERYWSKKDDPISAQVKRNWDAIEKLVAAHPYAINWGPVRPTTPRMAGLHPDSAPPKVKKNGRMIWTSIEPL
jgi:hypothetical protein